jgi:uncharacterized protein
MQPGRVILIFTLAVFFGGALLAPCLYWLAQWGADHFAGLRSVAGAPFPRFLNRSLMIIALLGVWPLMRALGACGWRELGWVNPRGQWSRLALGFFLGFVSLAGVVGLALLAEARNINDLQAARFASKLLSAAVSAGVVAILEETFFRGAILGSLRRASSPGRALVLSSAIYALVHFFQRPPLPPGTVHWFTGLQVLAEMLRGFAHWPTLVPGFFTLTLAGLILGLAYQRTGNLYFSIGLHAGWIFWLKFSGAATIMNPAANFWLWGSAKLIDGWLAMMALALVLLVLLWSWKAQPVSESDEHMDNLD